MAPRAGVIRNWPDQPYLWPLLAAEVSGAEGDDDDTKHGADLP